MSDFAPVEEQLAQVTRGVVDLHVRAELAERLDESRKTGRPLRIKVGFDPTRPDLHIGHAVIMAKMRQFQDLGHTAILLVGDFTARAARRSRDARSFWNPSEARASCSARSA